MAKPIRAQLGATIAGFTTLFLGLTGGTAIALDGSNTVFSDDISNGEVKSVDLGTGEVKAADIATGSILGAKLAADAVNSAKLGDGQVKAADLAPGAVSSSTIANGAILGSDVQNNALTGAQVDESTLAGLWFVGGNADTGSGDFLGTTDNQPLELGVNDAPALRIEPAVDGMLSPSPNLIGGSPDNSVTPGVVAATIAGGGRIGPETTDVNGVTDSYGTVGGGSANHAGDGAGTTSDRLWATVAGGNFNTASGEGATVAGGNGNLASAGMATVSGGGSNIASGTAATAVGGDGNFAEGDYSLAAGRRARANHDGAFVWADSTGSSFPSTADNQFSVRSLGGARFVSATDGTGTPTAGVELAPGGGSWSSLSDEASKRAVEPVSGREVLRKLSSVPISTWSYRSQDESIRHIGPMAQDFYRAFDVGEDRRRISSVDADGVALAAIQGLNRKVKRLQQKVAALEGEGSR